MKIIKRNGAEVPFDITKIITAVTKASDSVGGQSRLTREQITQIAAAVTDQCQALNRAVSVEEVQDLVENQLMDIQAHDVARHYITYRYVQSLKRQTNTTDERILSLIECQNEEVKQENANKNPTVNSVQRDYMAGEISKDLTARLLLDPEIVKAHQEGLIHFHDSDYFAQHMHNCDLVNLEDMLQNGTVISGTYIEKPHSFSTACNIATQIIAQVASNQYGGQSISLTHLAPFVDVSRKKIAAEVEVEMEGLDVSAERKKEIVERRLRNEINRGVQTIQYQVVTLMTTNGQAPFITVFMYLGEARNAQEKADLAIIIEETIRQRYQGVKNEAGVWITPAFPKLIYVLEGKMTIVYLYTALCTVGGADRSIIQKANYLADEMHQDVFIITDSQKERPPVFPISPRIRHIDIGIDFDRQYHHNLLVRGYYYFTLMHLYRKKLEYWLKTLKPDIVISTLGRELDFLTQLDDGSVKIGESHIAKPYTRNLHLMEQRGFPYKQIARHWRKKQEEAVKKLDALVVLTQHDADNWKEVKKACVIPNFLPFSPEKGSSCLEKRIISIGRYSEQKGYDRLIEAWIKVNRKHPDWHIRIYGEGQDRNSLQELIEKHHIENSFSLCPPTKSIQEKYLESSIYVMSSRFEGLPMALLEAMACGVPCISFDCPYGPAEIITPEEDGILVKNGNTDELADAICRLIEDTDKRIRMGKQAQKNIQRYSREEVMKLWDELFNTLTTARP